MPLTNQTRLHGTPQQQQRNPQSPLPGFLRASLVLPALANALGSGYKKRAGSAATPPARRDSPPDSESKVFAPVRVRTSYRGDCVIRPSNERPQPQGRQRQKPPAHPGESAAWANLLQGDCPGNAVIMRGATVSSVTEARNLYIPRNGKQRPPVTLTGGLLYLRSMAFRGTGRQGRRTGSDAARLPE